MRFEKQDVKLLTSLNEDTITYTLDQILGVPYKQETKDAKKRIESCIKRGHLSVLEHFNITLDCLTNIETYKDFTRHRHCAFTIESTSFVKYPELVLIVAGDPTPEDLAIYNDIERRYKEQPYKKIARDILPQCTAARMIMTTNIREWRYIIELRGDPNDNPLTLGLRNLMWIELHKYYPFYFPMPEDDSNIHLVNRWGFDCNPHIKAMLYIGG